MIKLPTEMSAADDGLNKVTTLLEDISIKPATSQEDECIITCAKNTKLPTIDSKTIELLELLSRYEELANNEFRLNFINGFLNLSRANYSSGTVGKKFGIDSYDLREYSACKEIRYSNQGFEARDVLKIHIEKEKAIKEKKASEKDKKDDNEDVGSKKVITSATESHEKIGNLRNRKTKTQEVMTESSDPNKVLRDPLKQFGALVPYQLRHSQSYFAKGLNNSIEILNLQKRINTLISEIDDIKNERNGI